MAAIGKDVAQAARLLACGAVVAIPTETVYGLAANALDALAVSNIFKVKERPLNNPLILHISGREALEKYVTEVPPVAEKLISEFWPGSLTLLLPKKESVPDLVTASLPHVAVRVPEHPMALDLLQKLDFPLAAPSANPYGYISPTRPEHVQQQIGEKIPYILDGGPCKAGVESTIVGFLADTPIIYRLGAITAEAIEAVAGEVRVHVQKGQDPLSPGMMPYHYSPNTTLYLTDKVEELLRAFPAVDTGVITFHTPIKGFPEAQQVVLSAAADMQEAAANLYTALHHLDGLGLSRIVAGKLPDYGLGRTINERLHKAAGKKSANIAAPFKILKYAYPIPG